MTALLLMGLLSNNAEAVEWPNLETPVYKTEKQSQDRVVIIALEEYNVLPEVRNAEQSADAWFGYFTETLGIPEGHITVLKSSEASALRIESALKKSSKKLHKEGKLWVLYIGHGLTMYDTGEAAILPFYTDDSIEGLYSKALPMSLMSQWSSKADGRDIFIFDASFNGLDRKGQKISMSLPSQKGVLPNVSSKSTIITAAQPGEYAGMVANQPALSYLLLGALRGWGDSDANGWINLTEAVDFADDVSDTQQPNIQGRYRRQKISEAREQDPRLLEPNKNRIEQSDVLNNQVSSKAEEYQDLGQLLQILEQQRKVDIHRDEVVNERVAQERNDATKYWQQIKVFATQRADDQSLVAVETFVKKYSNLVVEVEIPFENGAVEIEKVPINIPEVLQAAKLLTQLQAPAIENVEFVWLPSGDFVMGATQGRTAMHRVSITQPFYISTTEVTQGLYESVMDRNPSEVRNEDYPVTNISWYDAIEFANQLSAQQGLPECYVISDTGVSFPKGTQCQGYRLPTEAEWEYAAKASKSYAFSGGERVERMAWTRSNSGNEVHFVRSKYPNAWGLYDMSGNVWEWTWDRFAPYDLAQDKDPMGAATGDYRVRRGGAANAELEYAKVDARYQVYPDYSDAFQGLRLVRTAPLIDDEI